MALDTRLNAALKRRAALFAAPDTDAFRLIHRAADGYTDLAVDRYAEVLVAHIYSSGAVAPAPLTLLRTLAERIAARAVYVKYRPAQANTLTKTERASLAPAIPVWGTATPEVTVHEGGLRFLIQPGAGLSAGLFLDMRETRAWVRAHAAGQTVLNCFAYTCGFGVAAVAGGAVRVVNLDVSRSYLDWGRRNYALNGLQPEGRDFITGDVFDWLRRFSRRGQTFGLVILDPPSYSTSKGARFTVQRDYAELAALAARVVAPGGWLVACANAAELPARAFYKQMRAGLRDFPARITHSTHEPGPDFPVAPGDKPYLKICFVRFAQP